MQDLFRRWDSDKSNSISLDEFCEVLRELEVAGSTADYASLFTEWDVDGSGTIQYTELIRALSGKRYDAIRRDRSPPLPPLVIFAPADPCMHNKRWLDDVALLVHIVAHEKSSLPPFTPLGLERGPLPASTDLPSWSRPLIYCDPSGAPQQTTFLPLGSAFRHLFPGRAVPLWLGFAPGHTFALTRDACLRHGSGFYEHAKATCGLDQRRDAVAGLALERLWPSIFSTAAALDDSGEEGEVVEHTTQLASSVAALASLPPPNPATVQPPILPVSLRVRHVDGTPPELCLACFDCPCACARTPLGSVR